MITFKQFLYENDERLQQLMAAIQSGKAPKIQNATYVRDAFAWGDLERLGLAQRGRERVGGGMVEEWWEYSPKAPGPITLNTMGGQPRVMQPGDKTNPIEVDYS